MDPQRARIPWVWTGHLVDAYRGNWNALDMLGLRFSRMVHAAIATGSLALTGCLDRALLDPSFRDSESGGQTDTEGATDSGTESDGSSTSPTSPTSSTDPTNPTNPTNPTSPATTSPTNPTDPTDPTGYVDGPPQLIDVQLINPTTIELYFNEAMTDPSAIDPSSFRLSLGYSNYYAGYGEYGGTFYTDLSRFTGEENCYEYCNCYEYDPKYQYCQEEYCNYFCNQQPGPPINPLALQINPSFGNRFLMTLDSPVTTSVCNTVREYEQNWTGAGLFLHYSNNTAPLVGDRQGDVLAPISEAWVLPPMREYSYTPGYFEAMTPFIPIPCPF